MVCTYFYILDIVSIQIAARAQLWGLVSNTEVISVIIPLILSATFLNFILSHCAGFQLAVKTWFAVKNSSGSYLIGDWGCATYFKATKLGKTIKQMFANGIDCETAIVILMYPPGVEQRNKSIDITNEAEQWKKIRLLSNLFISATIQLEIHNRI